MQLEGGSLKLNSTEQPESKKDTLVAVLVIAALHFTAALGILELLGIITSVYGSPSLRLWPFLVAATDIMFIWIWRSAGSQADQKEGPEPERASQQG